MPYIFPPIQQTDDDTMGKLLSFHTPTVNGPNGVEPASALPIMGSAPATPSNPQQDLLARDYAALKSKQDAYEQPAHGILGHIAHFFRPSEAFETNPLRDNIAQDEATSLASKRESDSVANEQANRTAEQSRFDAGAPQRDATLAATKAGTEKTEQESKPLSQSDADTFNHLYNSKGFSAGMTPEETTRLTEAHKTIAEMKARQAEFTQRQQLQAQNHADTEKDRALTRDIAQQNHQDKQADHEGDLGRKVLDKAEGTYRSGSQAADEMQTMIDGARSGNAVYSAALPLEGALAINTSQGVKRINRTEVDQIAGAGSLFDKIHGEISKLKTGVAIPEPILKDQEQLVKLLKQGSYKTYSDTFDSTKQRYGMANETKLPGPNGEGANGAPPAGAKIRDYSQLGSR